MFRARSRKRTWSAKLCWTPISKFPCDVTREYVGINSVEKNKNLSTLNTNTQIGLFPWSRTKSPFGTAGAIFTAWICRFSIAQPTTSPLWRQRNLPLLRNDWRCSIIGYYPVHCWLTVYCWLLVVTFLSIGPEPASCLLRFTYWCLCVSACRVYYLCSSVLVA